MNISLDIGNNLFTLGLCVLVFGIIKYAIEWLRKVWPE